MIEERDLNKLKRLSERVREMTRLIQKEERRNLHSFKKDYTNLYELVKPIIIDNHDYKSEFLSLREPGFSYQDMKPAFVDLLTFLDSVVREETLKNRQLIDTFASEYFIDEKSPFTAYKRVGEIMETVVNSLKIVDNFVNTNTLDYFLQLNTQADLRVITKMCSPTISAFKTALKKFESEWQGTKVDIKLCDYFHDRYLIIDDRQVWHVGPSLNYLGKKPAMITLIQDEEIRQKVIDLFNKQWAKSRSL